MSKIKILEQFLHHLSQRKSSESVFNQYEDPRILNNLRIYFQYLINHGHGPLMIGEAPGHRGCRLTGIPFTSTNQIFFSEHQIFKQNINELFLSEKSSEATATIVWEKIKPETLFPVFWNSFPFHPSDNGKPRSNRPPTSGEVEEGATYLRMLLKIFEAKKIYAIGGTAKRSLKKIFSDVDVVYIRHPSRGGKKDFLAKIYEEKIQAWGNE